LRLFEVQLERESDAIEHGIDFEKARQQLLDLMTPDTILIGLFD